jgi:hypothetical protein
MIVITRRKRRSNLIESKLNIKQIATSQNVISNDNKNHEY